MKYKEVKKIVLICLMMLLLSISVQALDDIKIEKTAPEEIKFNSNLKVDITVFYNRNKDIKIKIEEVATDADPINPAKFVTYDVPEGLIAVRPPHYEWELNVRKSSSKTISYTIKPNRPGVYTLGPTVGYVEKNRFTSNSLRIKVVCNKNNNCEENNFENYYTCPEDCPSGSPDKICDLISDGKCDPDCTKEADTDCTCGNGICEPLEDRRTCPFDCKISFWEWLLNLLKGIFT